MNTNTSPHCGSGRAGSSTRSSSSSSSSHASGSGTHNQPYDEERLELLGEFDTPSPRWSLSRRCIRLPRPKKSTTWLLLIDLTIIGLLVIAFWPLITLLLYNERLFGARLALPVEKTPHTEDHYQQHAIPRILHQTSATEQIRDDWVKPQQSCKDAYSNFEYMHWTDALARDLIATEYPWFLDTWDNYPFPIQHADSLRYFVLHRYGGIYLDMDTWCNASIPIHQIEAAGGKDLSVFKSTSPTGVSNDLMITTARHPIFEAVIKRLVFYNKITRPWSSIQPHTAVMMSAGPLFLTLVLKSYLLQLPSLPTPSFQVVNATQLLPYLTDLEGQSWHHGDTQAMMWIGERPWVWYLMGAIGLAVGTYIVNFFLLLVWNLCTKRRTKAQPPSTAQQPSKVDKTN
ncbi:Mannosyl phosphorylinositol ceramide synthase CSH1 like protein [Verticillium longisporum]|uniref:Mannosyl phosphorylinositol ceramide synthase CSH1 like protein n=1 Tax=Verticillium longisporum TaxID=100787 RepID=A0A0G4M7I8_VERLO|nr:Mannosyl phosphorylinositol ceramide synthase CSH1 like protein [Verticillium longisporum]CRK29850.1 hypothetical protein BN1708_015695 [Verticillium longisporum]